MDEQKTTVANKRRGERYTLSITRGSWSRPAKWGNPFRLRGRDELGEVECLLAHAEHLLESGLVDEVGELRGHALGCVCAPERCHGDTLARLADAEDARAELELVLAELRDERDELLNRVGGVQQDLFGGEVAT